MTDRSNAQSNTVNRRRFLGAAGVAAAGAGCAGTPVNAPLLGSAGSAMAYGPAAGVAKLDSNENPYGPSAAALQAMSDACAQGAYYVTDSVTRLKAMIAERNGVTPEHISLSSGSSGVLTYLAVAKSREGRILGPDLFWDTTVKAAIRQGAELKRTPKTADLAIDLDAVAAAISDDVALVHITNPNNPTGMLLDNVQLRRFTRAASGKATVLVDEAYNELTDNPEANTMVDLIREGRDVVVARTFSKIYGLAGMRVGYSIARPETARLIDAFGIGDYALNQAGLAAAVASYNDTAFLALSKSKIIEGREMIVAAARAGGLNVLPSATNFVFVDLGNRNANEFRAQMAERNVLIRGVYRDYTNWSRVSMGQLRDVEQYVAALPRVLDAMPA